MVTGQKTFTQCKKGTLHLYWRQSKGFDWENKEPVAPKVVTRMVLPLLLMISLNAVVSGENETTVEATIVGKKWDPGIPDPGPFFGPN